MRVARRHPSGIGLRSWASGLGAHAACLRQWPPELGFDPRARHENCGARRRVDAQIHGQDEMIALADEAAIVQKVLALFERGAASRRDRFEPNLAARQDPELAVRDPGSGGDATAFD